MTPDLYGAWLTAVAALGLACWAIRRYLRRKPAAPDNVPPQDTEALWICRRIAALPTTNPDIARPANNYLRPGEETP